MFTDADMDFIAERAEVHTLDYLRDVNNYPTIDGKLAFFDDETAQLYADRGWKRSDKHLIEQWFVKFHYDGVELRYVIGNKKEVDGWKLVSTDDTGLLEAGTNSYSSLRSGTNFMHFYDRYRNKWNFNRVERHGIRGEIVDAFNDLIHTAAFKGLVEALRDFKNRRF